MAVKPYTWVSWSQAQSRMFKISSRWLSESAMVNSLRRLDPRYYRGEAHELNKPWLKVPLEVVVAGLVDVLGDTARYGRPGCLVRDGYGGYAAQYSDITGAELAWEEFRDDLIRFELPASVMPKPDPAESTKAAQEWQRQRAPYRGALAEWMGRKGITLLRRMTTSNIAAAFESYCRSEKPKLLPLLPLRLRSMEGTIERIIKKMEAAVTAAESKKTGGKGPIRANSDH